MKEILAKVVITFLIQGLERNHLNYQVVASCKD